MDATTDAPNPDLSSSSAPAITSTQKSTSSVNLHLSYPTPTPEAPTDPSTPSSSQTRQLLKDRLYVGNLHPTVDEYTLLQVFSKFGKVTKLDFLFHKTGLMKGKPRGYAFVEYGNKDDAIKALGTAHDKLLRGRKLIVTFAHQAPLDQVGSTNTKHRKGITEAGRPTTLSMLKTGMGGRHDGTKDKIAMMEAKLRQMEASNPNSNASSSSMTHPSLPLKPPPHIPTDNRSHVNSNSNPQRTKPVQKPKAPLPSLPILPQSQSQSTANAKASSLSLLSRPAHPQVQQQKPSVGLVGVKIGKAKEK